MLVSAFKAAFIICFCGAKCAYGAWCCCDSRLVAVSTYPLALDPRHYREGGATEGLSFPFLDELMNSPSKAREKTQVPEHCARSRVISLGRGGGIGLLTGISTSAGR